MAVEAVSVLEKQAADLNVPLVQRVAAKNKLFSNKKKQAKAALLRQDAEGRFPYLK